MALLTIEKLDAHIPLDVFDANGMVIRREIVAFDPVTGYVRSYVYEKDGSYRINYTAGEIETREEFYPAPLVWRSISIGEVESTRKRYWDLVGR